MNAQEICYDHCRHAVDAIIEDLTDRGGLRQVWDSIDEDTQLDIRAAWIAIVYERLKP